MIEQAVILCGGKGTRLGAEFSHVPKPLVPVDGLPLLERILGNAARAGVERVILAAGHLGEQIRERYAAHNPWSLEIHTHIEGKPLGTAGCLHEVADLLDDQFVLLYGDVFLDFDLGSLIARHEQGKPVATILVRQSDHPKDSDLVEIIPGSDRVCAFLPKATRDPEGTYHNCANAAVYACSKELLDFIAKDVSSDIATHVFPSMLAAGKEILAHWLEDQGYVKDMGTPARLVEVERYWRRKQKAIAAQSAPQKVRALIFDRDGVILRDHGPSNDPEKIEFMPKALEGMAAFAEQGLACMVATNQPWIARGLLTASQLEMTHERMKSVIAEHGGSLLDIAFSPFHPETHHNEGVRELRRASECRKPRAGMLFELMERHDFDPAETVMLGDSKADVIAARNAGTRVILIGDDPVAKEAAPDANCSDLLEAATLILKWNQ